MNHIVLRNGTAAKDYQALNNVMQFTDVTCPLVLFQFLHSFISELRDSLAHVLRDDVDEVIHQ